MVECIMEFCEYMVKTGVYFHILRWVYSKMNLRRLMIWGSLSSPVLSLCVRDICESSEMVKNVYNHGNQTVVIVIYVQKMQYQPMIRAWNPIDGVWDISESSELAKNMFNHGNWSVVYWILHVKEININLWHNYENPLMACVNIMYNHYI